MLETGGAALMFRVPEELLREIGQTLLTRAVDFLGPRKDLTAVTRSSVSATPGRQSRP